MKATSGFARGGLPAALSNRDSEYERGATGPDEFDHVAMDVGDGKMVDAPAEGRLMGARRVVG